MPNKINLPQVIVMVLSGFFAVGGVLMFSFLKSNDSQGFTPVTVWGTIDPAVMVSVIDIAESITEYKQEIKYTYIPESRYDESVLLAFANNTLPDVFMLTNENVLQFENRMFTIPPETYPAKLYRDTFIDAGDAFLNNRGTVAIPFSVDPIVMYYNKTILTNENIVSPPVSWNDVTTIAPTLSIVSGFSEVSRSAVPFGEYSNVSNAREILMTLLTQAGNNVTTRNYVRVQNSHAIESTLSDDFGLSVSPAESVLNFYTQFSNPSKKVYSWNRSLPSSRAQFLAGDLALYFDYASEYNKIKSQNPNLNFDVTVVPQRIDGSARKTYAKLSGLAISNSSQNKAGAMNVITYLTNPWVLEDMNKQLVLPSIMRSQLSINKSLELGVFDESALISQSVLDPSPRETDIIFKDMVESFTSGRTGLSTAVRLANDKLDLQLNSLP